jgi:hypothetical protein
MSWQNLLSAVFLVGIVGCSDTIKIDPDPCRFAPPQSKFPVLNNDYYSCTECFLSITIRKDIYRFEGNQVGKSLFFGDFEFYNPGLFMMIMKRPKDARALLDSKGQYVNFVTADELRNKEDVKPLATFLQLEDYCEKRYSLVTTVDPFSGKDLYHRILDVKVAAINTQSQGYLGDFYITGEFVSYINVEGEELPVNGNYKLLLHAVPFD